VEACKSRVASNESEFKERVESLKREYDVTGFEEDETPLMNILAVADQIESLADENGLDGVALQSFMSLVDAMGAYCMPASGIVGENLPIAEESDIHGAVSNVMLHRVTYGATTYLTEYTVRHPDNDNAVLLWHAGAPPSTCHPDVKPRIGHHWILPSPLSGMSHFKMRDGELTMARFDGDQGEYKLAVGRGKTIPGPDTLNNYLWCEVDDWPRWERTLMNGPFIHHTGMVYGDYLEPMLDACAFIPGLEPVAL
jgi:L-fucose isomerase-like protein